MSGHAGAILLAAGQGTRLSPYTNDRPKCMVELGGMTLIDRQLALLERAGLSPRVVVAGYRAAQIPAPGAVKIVNEQYASTNMVASLICARAFFDRPMLVTYGDVLLERRLLDAVAGFTGDVGVAVDAAWAPQFRHRYGSRYVEKAEALRIGDDGFIETLGQPALTEADVHGQFIGLMKLSVAALQTIAGFWDEASQLPDDRAIIDGRTLRQLYSTDLIQLLIQRGMRARAIVVEGGWLEVDDATDLELYRREWAHAGRLPYFDPAAG
jgi:L-glutamine-phosphate cytidylyltransferase